MKILFEEMRSPEVGELAARHGMVIVPIGACEEHSRHLPVMTDTIIAREAALAAGRAVADRIPLAVLPPVWFGYTVAALKKWPGTLTVRPKVLVDVMVDLCRSLIDIGLDKILIVNGHGNNPGVLDVAVRTLADRRNVYAGVVNTYACLDADMVNAHRKSAEGGVSHAGEVETALMLYLSDCVEMSAADDADRMSGGLKTCPTDAYSGRKKRLYLSAWFLEKSVNGGLGDPTPATKEFGKLLFESMVRNLAEVIEDFYAAHVGRGSPEA